MKNIEQSILDIINNILLTDYLYKEIQDKELVDLGFDSLLFVRLVVEIEGTFYISVDMIDLEKGSLKTVNSVVATIKEKMIHATT